MKRIILLAAVAVFAIQSASAQSRGGGQGQGQGQRQEQGQGQGQGQQMGKNTMRISPERLVEKRYKELNKYLEFTEEQEVEVRALLLDFFTPGEGKKQKEPDLAKDIKELLTDKQLVSFKEYQKDQKKNKLSQAEQRLELVIDIAVYELDDSLNLSDEQEEKVRTIIAANTELPEQESEPSEMGGGMSGMGGGMSGMGGGMGGPGGGMGGGMSGMGGGMSRSGSMSMGERPVRMPSVDIPEISDKIASVLTDDQKIKFDAIVKEKIAQKKVREERMQQMMQRMQQQQ